MAAALPARDTCRKSGGSGVEDVGGGCWTDVNESLDLTF